MDPNQVGVWAMALGTVGISLALLTFILAVFQNDIFTSGTTSYNITSKFLDGIYNVAAQVPNAGKIIGIGLIVFAFAGLGIGGYTLYNRVKQ